jgi:hypothetical protein
MITRCSRIASPGTSRASAVLLASSKAFGFSRAAGALSNSAVLLKKDASSKQFRSKQLMLQPKSLKKTASHTLPPTTATERPQYVSTTPTAASAEESASRETQASLLVSQLRQAMQQLGTQQLADAERRPVSAASSPATGTGGGRVPPPVGQQPVEATPADSPKDYRSSSCSASPKTGAPQPSASQQASFSSASLNASAEEYQALIRQLLLYQQPVLTEVLEAIRKERKKLEELKHQFDQSLDQAVSVREELRSLIRTFSAAADARRDQILTRLDDIRVQRGAATTVLQSASTEDTANPRDQK